MALGGRLALLVALGLLLVALPGIILVSYAIILALAVAIDLARAGAIADVVAGREPVVAVRLGEMGATSVRLRNSGHRTVRARVRDAWVPSAGIAPREQDVTIPPGEARTVTSVLRPTRRGTRAAARLTVRSYGPLRLAARQRRVDAPGSIRVLPAFTSRRFLPEKLSRLRQIDGAVLVHQRGQGSEFDSLREYVLGDDVRAIDWRATARAGDVVVRTWRPERDRHVVLVIDTGRTSAARIGDAPRLDAALDASLLLAAVAARAGDRIALVAGDITIRARLAPTGGSGALPALVAALTPLEPTLIETDPQVLIGEVRRRTPQRALVVVFGALDAASADSTLLPVAAALAGRHQVVVASVADPRLDELAHARDSVSDLYTAGAAEVALARRRSVAARLARLGVRVVDGPVDSFASHVTDAYLDLKAAGRL
jgi:uncharacterized protein (DUF58 family)